MTILTSYTSATYKAQIRTSPESGFIAGYQGTCTESEAAAARNLVRKYYGKASADTVREVRDPAEISRLVPAGWFKSPRRKQIFSVFTFDYRPRPIKPAPQL